MSAGKTDSELFVNCTLESQMLACGLAHGEFLPKWFIC